MNENPYLSSYQATLYLFADPDFTAVPHSVLEEYLIQLEKRVIPTAARRFYQTQRSAVEDYEAVLLGIYDDFSEGVTDVLEAEQLIEAKVQEVKRHTSQLAYWLCIAGWDWFHYVAPLGKLSTWFSATEELIVQYEWQRFRLFIYRKLTTDLLRALITGVEDGKDIPEILEGFKWRVRMYSGHAWIVMQKLSPYRPHPEERVKAKEKWEPPTRYWKYPPLAPLTFPLLWTPPAEWGAPEEFAPDVPPYEILAREVYWHGSRDERTCLGPTGCWPRIGKLWKIATLNRDAAWPGGMLCLSNCRCALFPVGERGVIIADPEWYELPW